MSAVGTAALLWDCTRWKAVGTQSGSDLDVIVQAGKRTEVVIKPFELEGS